MVYRPLLAAFLAASVAVVDGRILSGNLEKEGTVDKFKHEAPGQLLKLERPPKEDRIDDDEVVVIIIIVIRVSIIITTIIRNPSSSSS